MVDDDPVIQPTAEGVVDREAIASELRLLKALNGEGILTNKEY